MKRLTGDTGNDSVAAATEDDAAGAGAAIYNPPGQPTLSFRAGTYASFLEGMLDEMQMQALRTGPAKGRSPLALLNVGGESNFALALLQAWAVVGDVLTFYQERIINEGYLRTATEPRSWLYLVRTVGYEPNPGLAATTYLAFNVRDAKRAPAQVVVPAGTGVMSTPKQPSPGAKQTPAQQPQTFETAETINARAEWNAMRPYVPVATIAQEVYTGTTLLYLAGTTTRLKPAATVLLVGDVADPAGGTAATQFLLRTVASVEADAKNGYTVVTLQPATGADAPNAQLVNPEFYAFRQQARLFGYNATQWADAPANVRQQYGTPKGGAFVSEDGGATWRPRNSSMPQGDVQALVVNEGVMLAGVAGGGVYRLPAGGDAAWEPASSGLTRSDVHCLVANALGHLYAGTAGGGVFRSTDNGETWVMLSAGTVTLKKDKDGNLLPTTTRLPNTVVRALATYTDADTDVTTIYAGTDNGVYTSKDDLSGWEPLHQLLPDLDRKGVLASTVVNTLAVRRSLGRTLVYAGTDNSVYLFHPVTGWWADNKNLPGAERASDRTTAKIYALHAYSEAGEDFRLLAATSAGVYRYRSEWSGWELASAGLPLAGSPPGSPPVAVTSLASSADATTDATVLFAATTVGLYTSRDDGSNWSPVEAALYQPLFAVASEPYASQLDAGIVSDDLAQQFKNHSVALSNEFVVVIVESEGASWFISDVTGGRTYALAFDGAASIDVYLTNSEVSAVAAGANGLVAAAAPLDGYVENEWPDFVVNPHRFDLDTIHGAILDGSYVALSQPAPPSGADSPPASPPAEAPPSEVHQVVTSTTAPVNEFGRSATTTTVETGAPDAPASFDRRATNLFLQSEQLPLLEAQLSRPVPVQGKTIELAGLVQGFRDNQPLAFTGRQASAVIVADLGGVFRLDGADFAPAGLQNTEINALACDAVGRLFAGTRGSGLFIVNDGGDATQLKISASASSGASANAGASANVCALACDDAGGSLLAATEGGGFYVSTDQGATWSRVALPAANDVSAFAFGGDGAWLCATDGGGVFRSEDAGQTWTHARAGLTATDITSLAVVSRSGASRVASQPGANQSGAGQSNAAADFVFAGTRSGGVFRSADGGATWRAVNAQLANTDVRALAVDQSGRLFAGTSGGGVFRSSDGGATWRAASNGLAARDVRALAYDAAGKQLFAGTRGGGAFVSADGGAKWTAAPTGVSNDVRALAAGADGQVFAGARNVAVLTSADGTQSVETRSVPLFAADEQYRADLDLGIIPDALAKLFAAENAPLAKGASVTVEQAAALWLFSDGAGGIYVVKNEASALVVYRPSYALRVAAAPAQAQGSDAQTWSVVTDANFAGLLTARPGEISFGPAAAAAPTVSEIGFALGVSSQPNESFSTVTLDSPLANVFDPDTLAVCANVAYATHGETVPLEVLGSGDASRPGQSFTLKKPPLTYVPTPASPDLAKSTLSVSISSVVAEGGVQLRAGTLVHTPQAAEISTRWKEVATLYDAGPQDRVYEVRADTKGDSTVVFGDGEHGARLPTGAENVVATYRSGSGTAGNLDAGQLTMLKSKPAGVRSVTNPAAAAGGVNPEPMLTARTMAPLTVRTLGRIVSLLDYEDFVRTQPGVGKARVQTVYGGRARVVYLTVAMEDGTPLSPDSNYYRDLSEAIDNFQASAQAVRIGGYEPLVFNLTARVRFDSSYEAKQIEKLIREALVETYSFDRRHFGEGVESSEVIAIIQDTIGVVSVRLEAFYVVGSSETVEPRLDADLARWDKHLRQIRPAQLLTINPAGVVLHMEKGAP